jgi:hypothetical protein
MHWITVNKLMKANCVNPVLLLSDINHIRNSNKRYVRLGWRRGRGLCRRCRAQCRCRTAPGCSEIASSCPGCARYCCCHADVSPAATVRGPWTGAGVDSGCLKYASKFKFYHLVLCLWLREKSFEKFSEEWDDSLQVNLSVLKSEGTMWLSVSLFSPRSYQ